MAQDIKIRIFIGGKPLEQCSDAEREAMGETVARRMGEVMSRYYTGRPEEIRRIIRSTEERYT